MPAQHPQQGTGEFLHIMNIYHQPVFSLSNNSHLYQSLIWINIWCWNSCHY